MKKPDTIKLLGRTYTIIYDLKRAGDDYGEVKFRGKVLHINKQLPPLLRDRTILHEAIHAGLADLGLMKWADEGLVGPLEYIVYHLVHDNPWLVKKLMEDET